MCRLRTQCALSLGLGCVNKEEKANEGKATQNIHPPLMQDTHTHTTAHTASLIHLLVKYTRETYTQQR